MAADFNSLSKRIYSYKQDWNLGSGASVEIESFEEKENCFDFVICPWSTLFE